LHDRIGKRQAADRHARGQAEGLAVVAGTSTSTSTATAIAAARGQQHTQQQEVFFHPPLLRERRGGYRAPAYEWQPRRKTLWPGEQSNARPLLILTGTPTVFMESPMNKDQIAGKAKQVKGNVKETVGKVFGDKSLENEGKVDDAAGTIQQGYGDIKEDLKNGN
jgi:uncharacterized protein YjbJ (UPF0337 family)